MLKKIGSQNVKSRLLAQPCWAWSVLYIGEGKFLWALKPLTWRFYPSEAFLQLWADILGCRLSGTLGDNWRIRKTFFLERKRWATRYQILSTVCLDSNSTFYRKTTNIQTHNSFFDWTWEKMRHHYAAQATAS